MWQIMKVLLIYGRNLPLNFQNFSGAFKSFFNSFGWVIPTLSLRISILHFHRRFLSSFNFLSYLILAEHILHIHHWDRLISQLNFRWIWIFNQEVWALMVILSGFLFWWYPEVSDYLVYFVVILSFLAFGIINQILKFSLILLFCINSCHQRNLRSYFIIKTSRIDLLMVFEVLFKPLWKLSSKFTVWAHMICGTLHRAFPFAALRSVWAIYL